MDKIIKVITNEDFGLENGILDNPTMRYGARGIVINDESKIAVFNKQKKN